MGALAMMVAIVLIAAVLALAAVALLFLFNRLIRLRNKADNAWHQIDVELERRYDLLPKLAVVVKGYASHERETLETVARARAQAIKAEGAGEQGPAENNLTAAIGGVLAVAERYPDLKANRDFLEYQQELAGTENRIAGARKYYNGAVMYYNNARQSFPGNIVRRLSPGRFAGRDYFEIQEPDAREIPDASIGA
jgi:LemA protein